MKCVACGVTDDQLVKMYTVMYYLPKEIVGEKRKEIMGYVCSNCFEQLQNTKTESQNIITDFGYSADTE